MLNKIEIMYQTYRKHFNNKYQEQISFMSLLLSILTKKY